MLQEVFRVFRLPVVVLACSVLCFAAASAKKSGKVYAPGGDVTPPKLIHYVEPSVSHTSDAAFQSGTVRIVTIITRDGIPIDLHVTKGLSADQNRAALKAVKEWRFRPGLKGGRPVDVKVTVEVEFRLL
jgi:TonB family protein